MDVMRAFFTVNENRTDPLPGWRTRLHAEFMRRHPELNLTEQNVADRKHVIVRKGYLSLEEIDQIRRENGGDAQ